LSGEEYDYIIYEMSSYMLQDFDPQTYISVFNNVYRCHIDWHGSFGVYKQAKLGILTNAQHRIINSEFTEGTKLQWEYFGLAGKYQYRDNWFYIWDSKIWDNTDILLEWEHNRKNICAVIGVLDIIISDNWKIEEILKKVLQSFSGLPDRMEKLWEFQGISFINDAIATTPESTIAAIRTFEDNLQTLFLWGEDSWFDFSELRKKILQSNIENIIAFPDSTEKIFPEIESLEYDTPHTLKIEEKSFLVVRTRSMKVGVDFSYKHTKPWNISLLSCAAPSFSVWKSYRVKAEEFKKYVQEGESL
jgi:UDP-N-acetylmuramoylalanine--D-glutamate ligase